MRVYEPDDGEAGRKKHVDSKFLYQTKQRHKCMTTTEGRDECP